MNKAAMSRAIGKVAKARSWTKQHEPGHRQSSKTQITDKAAMRRAIGKAAKAKLRTKQPLAGIGQSSMSKG
jgi:hypothetical protein